MGRVSRRRRRDRSDGQDGILQGLSTPALFLLDSGVGLICLGVIHPVSLRISGGVRLPSDGVGFIEPPYPFLS